MLINPLPANFFRRVRILAGGQVIEDIDLYNRIYNMVHTLLPAERRMNDFAEGFGHGFLDNHSAIVDLSSGSVAVPQGIPQGKSKVVMFPLLCGLFNQSKFLPLRFMQGLQVELEVVSHFEDVCLVQAQGRGSACSQSWLIEEPYIKCDVITLDNQLDNEYTNHMMQGKTLPINFSSFVHQAQAIVGTDKHVTTMSRSFTRLKTVYVTFYKQPKAWDFENAEQLPIEATHLPLRECNFFITRCSSILEMTTFL
jgi:hypothetical protein